MNAHAAYIIQRVMEYGQMDDWRLINRYYGPITVVTVATVVTDATVVTLYILTCKS